MPTKLAGRAGIAAATIAMGAATALASAPSALAAGTSAPAAAPVALAKANSCPHWSVMKSAVNFRTGPGTQYRSIGYLYRGDWGRKVGAKGSWIKLKLEERSKTGLKRGTTAWVHKQFLDQCVYTQT
ncbi:SH3 domain-containing protein [Streptomyces sp. NBC_01304]|uniref:SH3 domain-containing protein n=1 Tax=Streptomyces sp. NBC_01304 TaxID=2903818 RepID=UPI002E0F251A|nr:SH3 domain-containing protein [Streptomyces sp. NBC_01304]